MVIKTTVNIDEETLREFRRVVASRYGSTRKLSAAIEEAIRSFNTAESLKSFAKARGIDTSTFPSVREVEKRRPVLETSAAETIRAMRLERADHIPRH
jgi:metal-responsive CopG/Arc/MetJ family transcriptional regulator